MPKKTPRIPPVARAEWTDAMRDLFAIFEGPQARENGSRFKAIMIMAHHPELAKAWLQYNVFLSKSLSLPQRLCEIVILRIAWRMASDYEWTQHAVIAEPLGLGEPHLSALKQPPDNPLWSDGERFAIRAVDELCAGARIEEATWQGLSAQLDRQQLLELMFVAGTYAMLAWIFNSVEVEPEDMGHDERREIIFSPQNVYGQRTHN